MTTAQAFSQFLTNIKVDKAELISSRYRAITKKLNKWFRDLDSETAYSLRVGSYGRFTGIKDISDLDMMYIIPDSKWDTYKTDPDKLLRDTREAVKDLYPRTSIRYDRLVVDVFFADSMTVEIQPVFQFEEEGKIKYKFPDTKSSTPYRVTMPKQEQDEMKRFMDEYGEAHRHLCKMLRAWKNTEGFCMGGLLIDTLTYNFLNDNIDYAKYTCSKYDELVKACFEYLKNEPDQEFYLALGSRQRVAVKHKFQNRAKKAFNTISKAIEESDEKKRHELWRSVFGRNFPKAPETCLEKAEYDTLHVTDVEEFIEDKYPVDIREELHIDCRITADGFRPMSLRNLLSMCRRIPTVRSLDFQIISTSVEGPYEVKWKVKNVGPEAVRRDCLRGQIVDSNRGGQKRHETSNFRGPHYVECYIIQNGVVVAKDRIEVPIE